MYATLRWEAIILLCENLQFGASLHLRCIWLAWVWVELSRGSINSPGSGLGWIGSGSMKWTHGQLWFGGLEPPLQKPSAAVDCEE